MEVFATRLPISASGYRSGKKREMVADRQWLPRRDNNNCLTTSDEWEDQSCTSLLFLSFLW